MTETTPLDPINSSGELTVAELDICSRQLQFNVGAALADPTCQHYSKAVALTAWVYARRANPTAKLDTYLQQPLNAIITALGWDGPKKADTEGEDFDRNPTDSAPESL